MTVHIIAQGKGGVGKSVVAYFLAQYLNNIGKETICLDTDPVNKTFCGFKNLYVKNIDLIENGEIIPKKFDNIIDIITNNSKFDIVIDNGASSFLPLNDYLLTNEIPELMKELGINLILHTVIVGADMLLHTLSGFAQMAKQYQKRLPFIVWLNSYFGVVQYENKEFKNLKAYKDNKDYVDAIIKIPDLRSRLYIDEMKCLLESRCTFDEKINNQNTSIIERQRLQIIKRDLFKNIHIAFTELDI